MLKDKNEFALDVIAMVSGHMITAQFHDLNTLGRSEHEFAARLALQIRPQLKEGFPVIGLAWALLRYASVRKGLEKTVGKKRIASLAPKPCADCKDHAYRAQAVLSYLCAVAAFTAPDMPEGYKEPDDMSVWMGTPEALLARRFINALKWAQDFGIIQNGPCPLCE